MVAPHPDDDVIGCGGTIYQLARDGVAVHVVYVTDGAASHPNSSRYPRESLAALRAREASAALELLGVRAAPTFLGIADGSLDRLASGLSDGIVRTIGDVVAATDATIVLAPHRDDAHPDHRAVAAIVDRVAADARRRIAVWDYVVWLGVRAPLPVASARARTIALSSSALDAKRRALRAHRSQMGAIADDPTGFRIDDALFARWTQPFERFYRRRPN